MSLNINEIFPNPLKGQYLKKGVWKLTRPFKYNNPPIKIVVPARFESDGASIPRFAYSIIGGRWTGKYVRGAIIHDWLYFSQSYSRKEADKIFLEAMKVLGVSLWKRRIMFLMVSTFAGFIWKMHKRRNIKAGGYLNRLNS